jgi:hypothetical protein
MSGRGRETAPGAAVSLPFGRGIDEEFELAGALATIAGVFLELSLHADGRRGSARYLDRLDDAQASGDADPWSEVDTSCSTS